MILFERNYQRKMETDRTTLKLYNFLYSSSWYISYKTVRMNEVVVVVVVKHAHALESRDMTHRHC